MTYMTVPQHKNPLPQGSWNLQFGRPFLGHYYYMYVLNLSYSCLGIEKKMFKEKYQFYTFYPQITPLPTLGLGGGVMKFTICCLLTPQMLHNKFGEDWPRSSWEEDVLRRRRTPTHSNRLSASDSGDLKSKANIYNWFSDNFVHKLIIINKHVNNYVKSKSTMVHPLFSFFSIYFFVCLFGFLGFFRGGGERPFRPPLIPPVVIDRTIHYQSNNSILLTKSWVTGRNNYNAP